MQEMVRAKHRVKMSTKLNDWPAGGPQKWLMEWQKLMGECKKWSPSLYEQWISDFNLVWGEVPGAKFMCSQMRMDHKRGNSGNWTVYQASQELLDAWNEKSIRNGMRQGGRQSMTKASFATEPRYNGEEADQEDDSEKKSKGKSKKDKKRKPSPTGEEEDSNKRKPCWVCGGSHQSRSCFLAIGIEPKRAKIPEENREIFKKRIEDQTFAAKIKEIRDVKKKRVELLT